MIQSIDFSIKGKKNMFRSLRPRPRIVDHLARRLQKSGTPMYALSPLRPVEQLRKRVAYARTASESWTQDPLGDAAAALGLYPFRTAERFPGVASSLHPLLAGSEELDPPFAVYVTSADEYVRSFALHIDSVRDAKPSSIDDNWALFFGIARRDPTVRTVNVVHFQRGRRDGDPTVRTINLAYIQRGMRDGKVPQ